MGQWSHPLSIVLTSVFITYLAMVVAHSLHRTLFRTSLFRSHFHTSHCLFAVGKAIRTFKLADIGEGITECEIIRW